MKNSRVTFLDRVGVLWILKKLDRPPIEVALWDGKQINTCTQPIARVQINNRKTLLKLCFDHYLAFGDGYTNGDITVEGNLTEFCEAIERSLTVKRPCRRGHLRPSQIQDNLQNIHQHYDIGNDFYQLWLDEQMVYTCAYYKKQSLTLAEAQLAKMDHICKKLRLKPGQTVIEAGCGWGGFALHMAHKYGVNVKAYNISEEQLDYARRRAREEGLENKVKFVGDDWCNIEGECDVFVSVGMLEHVGINNYRLLGELIRRTLKPHGLGLIHTIGRNVARPLNRWTTKRIFPGADPPSMRQMMDLFEDSGFSILDLENIRLHYARTLEHWLEQFNAQTGKIADMYDERLVRMWKLYLSASIATFQVGTLQLFQVLFTHANNNYIPWTREDIYAVNNIVRDSAHLRANGHKNDTRTHLSSTQS